MAVGLQRVVIAGTGAFLPNAPVPNERIEAVLGELPGAPPAVRSFITNMGPRILEGSGVRARHFAVDPETHRLTHTVTDLAEQASRPALAAAGLEPADVDLLLLSSPAPDFSTPPTSAMLQDRLGIAQCAEMEIHSNCSGVGKAVQIAYDALRVGRYRTALVVYAQLSSVYLRSCYLNQPTMNKKQATLRYILADGSGALVLRAVDTSNGGPLPHEILGTHLESVGCGRKPGMTAGGGMADMVPADGSPLSLYNAGRHHLDQDFAVVSQQAVPYLAQGVEHMLAALGVATASVDHYIYSVPGRQLYEANLKRVTEPFGVTAERVQFRAAQTGYCGGASVLIHLDEMVRSGELRPGQSAVVYSVESSKWMSGGFLLRW